MQKLKPYVWESIENINEENSENAAHWDPEIWMET
jgi:hypothetical protein